MALERIGSDAGDALGGKEAVTAGTIDGLVPGSFRGVLTSLRSELEAKFGTIVANTITGVVGVLLDLGNVSAAPMGVLLGGLQAQIEEGRIAGYSIVKPTPMALEYLVNLTYRNRQTESTFVQEAARHGMTSDRALTMIDAFRPWIGIPDALALLRQASVGDAQARAWIEENGLNPQHTTHLLNLSKVFLSVGEVVALWLREEISEADFLARLRELGFRDREQQNIKSLAFYIPPIPDLVRMAVREVFSPEQRKLLDLDAEFPPDFAKWAKRQGVSDVWSGAYWAAHWELPSPTQIFEMSHRTTFTQLDPTTKPLGEIDGKPYYKVISEETRNAALKALDYAPTWRDKMTAISYNPLTRVDVRRMRSLGLLNKEGVRKAYFDEGYNEENAQQLADFVEIDVMDDFAGKTKSQMLTMFRRGIVTEEELRAYLIRARVPVEFHDALIRAETDLREAEQLHARVKAIEKQFKRGIIDTPTMILRLTSLQLHSDALLHLSTLWVEEKLANQQRISIKDLKEVFGAGIISEEKFRAELKERNFQEDDIDMLTRLTGPISTTETEPELTT